MLTLRPALWMFAVASMAFIAGTACGQDFLAKLNDQSALSPASHATLVQRASSAR